MQNINELDPKHRWIVIRQSQAREPLERYDEWYTPRYDAIVGGQMIGKKLVLIDDRLIRFDDERSTSWPKPNIETLLYKQNIKWSYVDRLLGNGAMSISDIVEEMVNGDIAYVHRGGDFMDFETVWFPECMRPRADAFKLMYGCD